MGKKLKSDAIENIGTFVKELEKLRECWGDCVVNLHSETPPDHESVYSQAGLIFYTIPHILELKKRYQSTNTFGFKSYVVEEVLSNYFYFSSTFSFIEWLSGNPHYWGETYNNCYDIFVDCHSFNRTCKNFKASIVIERWSYFYDQLKKDV